MSDIGSELHNNNEEIVKLLVQLRKQRKDMNYLIEKQELEKGRIQNEIEKLTFKLTLRLKARGDYDKTIREVEDKYMNLVEASGRLLFTITKEANQLEQIMDKKTGTYNQGMYEVDDDEGPNKGEGSDPSVGDDEEDLFNRARNELSEQQKTELVIPATDNLTPALRVSSNRSFLDVPELENDQSDHTKKSFEPLDNPYSVMIDSPPSMMELQAAYEQTRASNSNDIKAYMDAYSRQHQSVTEAQRGVRKSIVAEAARETTERIRRKSASKESPQNLP